MRARVRWAKTQNNIVSPNPSLHQNVHHVPLGDVPLEPNLSVANIEMIDDREDVLRPLPAGLEELEMVVLTVGDDVALDVGQVGRDDFGLLPEIPNEDVLIFFQLFHDTID